MKNSEGFYKNLFKGSHDAIMLLDEKGFFDCNPATLEIFGIESRDRFIGTHPADLSPARQPDGSDSRSAAGARIRQALEQGTADFKWLHQRVDGTPFQAEVRLSRLDIGGRRVLTAVVRDISERAAAEERLRESEEKFRGVVDNIQIGISVISPEMRIVSLNRKMQEWFPRLDPSTSPLCYAAFNDPPCREVCGYCPTVKTLEDGLVHEAVTQTPSGDAVRRFRIVSSPLRNASGEIIAAIEMVEDLTDQMRAMDERLKMQKLESLGVMAGGIAHDFNNMLTALVGNLSCLQGAGELTPEQSAIIDESLEASRTAQGLTRQLLTFATGGAPVKAPVALGAVVEEAVRFASRGSQSVCRFEIAPDLHPVEADKGQLSQVVHNLTLNAQQAMSGGGEIAVRAWNRPSADGEAPAVCVSISDNGPGIPPSILGRIFDPYFSTKQTGRGLGLAACASILKRHDGTLDARSKCGEGATFEFVLPAAPGALVCGDPGEAVRGSGRVLILDDDEMVARVLARILAKLGYESEHVRDGREAVDKFLAARGGARPFAAAIMDLTIPGGMGGEEAAALLRKGAPEARLVVSSGYSDDSTLSQFEGKGFRAVLGKPYDASQVSQVLRMVLGGPA